MRVRWSHFVLGILKALRLWFACTSASAKAIHGRLKAKITKGSYVGNLRCPALTSSHRNQVKLVAQRQNLVARGTRALLDHNTESYNIKLPRTAPLPPPHPPPPQKKTNKAITIPVCRTRGGALKRG